MKKILLLFIILTSTLYAQPPIAQPNDLVVCDQNSDGSEVFDLTSTIPAILNGLNPSLYSETFYASLADAQNEVSPIVNPSAFINSSNPQTIYVRVFENANPTNFAITDFDLIVIPSVVIVQPSDLIIFESPFDGVAIFDLTSNQSVILNGIDPSAVVITYHETEADAQNGVTAILNPTSYMGIANPMTIYVRVQSATTDCFSITNFDIIVAEDGIIFFPDVNFKAKLLSASVSNPVASIFYEYLIPNPSNSYSIIDLNGDGEIQYSEAQNIKYLNVSSSNISNMTGIEAFVSIKYLACSFNQISSLNMSQNLELKELHCMMSQLTNLNISQNIDLGILQCSFNSLTQINVTQNLSLESLEFDGNNVSVLDVSQNLLLKKLGCSSNSLSSIDVTPLINLERLICAHNPTSTINITQNSNLKYLGCVNMNLTSLDLSLNYDLEVLGCGYNDLVNLDLSNNSKLIQLTCNNNLLLESLNLKNGSIENLFDFAVVPNLIFICVDGGEADAIQGLVNPNVVVNSYCSFNPGGDYNTITGTFQYDFNNNGCDSSDPNANYQGLAINIDAISTNSSVYSNGLGVYNLFTSNTGVYGLTPNLENASLFNVTPSPAEVPVMTINNSTVTQNFCISANGVHPDLEVVIAPVIPARPGFQAVYKIVYKNKGNQVMSQNYGLNFFYNHNLMSLVSTSVVPSAQATGGLQWDYANLMPFESRSILVTFLINAPTNTTNPVNIDDVLTFTSVISPQAGDETVADNTFAFNQTVVGSYDPNDITCLQGNLVVPTLIGEYLHYMIRFENTGTAPAENIVVKTEIDATQYNINSMQMLAASHNATIKRTGNILEFIFQDIQLDSGGHGNILLKIKSNGSLVEGDSVTENAAIYFDYNFPVITNDEETVFATLGINNPNVDAAISIYPNPVKEVVTIRSASQIRSIQLYDVQGRLLQTMVIDTNEYQFNLSERKTGIYFVKITSDNGSKIEKIIKE